MRLPGGIKTALAVRAQRIDQVLSSAPSALGSYEADDLDRISIDLVALRASIIWRLPDVDIDPVVLAELAVGVEEPIGNWEEADPFALNGDPCRAGNLSAVGSRDGVCPDQDQHSLSKPSALHDRRHLLRAAKDQNREGRRARARDSAGVDGRMWDRPPRT